MPKFPYMNFPFPYYNNRRFSNSCISSPSPTFSAHFQDVKANVSQDKMQYFNFKHTPQASSAITDSSTIHFESQKNKSNYNNNDYLFDLFGLKIYTDDVLLVSLIYFLYSEGVKDEGLFIVLILLLLS